VKLYGFPPSPNTWKVRALAHHLGLPLEHVHVDLLKGEQRKPEFLALNPTGRTPVLVDGEFRLSESTAIMQYIASRSRSDLWPADERTRADIMRWQSWQLQHWAKACEPMLFERVVKAIFKLGPPDQAVLAKATEVFNAEARYFDDHLSRRSHLVADRLTLADFSVASYLFHGEAGQIPLSGHANIVRWFQSVAALPCWAATAPRM